jgi:hypothetical protein
VRVTGLERFGLSETTFRRLGNRKVRAYIYLRTFDVTPTVQRLRPEKRLAHMSVRVNRWIERLYRLYPKLSFQVKVGKSSAVASADGRSFLAR